MVEVEELCVDACCSELSALETLNLIYLISLLCYSPFVAQTRRPDSERESAEQAKQKTVASRYCRTISCFSTSLSERYNVNFNDDNRLL